MSKLFLGFNFRAIKKLPHEAEMLVGGLCEFYVFIWRLYILCVSLQSVEANKDIF